MARGTRSTVNDVYQANADRRAFEVRIDSYCGAFMLSLARAHLT